jgi:PAS domain S-box-containing protein
MRYRNECVLLIEGSANDAGRILDELSGATAGHFRVEWVTRLSSALERLRSGGVGAVVLNLTLPDSQGIETFDTLFQAAPEVPILIVSEALAEEVAMKAVQRGANDYLRKDQADGSRLRRAIRSMMDSRAAAAMALENDASNVTLDSIGEAVLRTDPYGKVLYLNRVAEKMTGWSRVEALGRQVTEVLHIIDSAGAECGDGVGIIPEENESAKVIDRSSNCILVRRDGSECGIENRVTSIHDPDGKVTGSVVAFHDVTAARAASRNMIC